MALDWDTNLSYGFNGCGPYDADEFELDFDGTPTATPAYLKGYDDALFSAGSDPISNVLDSDGNPIPMRTALVSMDAPVHIDAAPAQPNHALRRRDLIVGTGDIFVDAGNKVIFEGSTGDTYWTYNAANQRLECYVNGTLAGWFEKPGA